MEIKKVYITLPWDLYADLCFLAADEDVRLKELIVSLLAKGIQKRGQDATSSLQGDDSWRSKAGIGEFVRKFLIRVHDKKKQYKIGRSEIYRRYKPWAIKMGYIPVSNQKFYRYLETLPGVSCCRINKGTRAFSGMTWADI